MTLGKTDVKGKNIGGTLLEVDSSGGSPAFVNGGDQEAAGEVDCFAIRTRSEFTTQEAKLSQCSYFSLTFTLVSTFLSS